MLEQNKINDRKLAQSLACPSYKEMSNLCNRFEWINNLLIPIFNAFQLEKSRNNIKFYSHNLQSLLSQRLKNVPLNEKENYIGYLQNCVKNYYKLFKGKFYNRYKVLSFTTPYSTSILPLEYNIDGKVDLILKTSYGITLVNYVYNISNFMFYYNVGYSGIKLQIAGRCMKLITGIKPDLLCLIIFTKRHIFKRIFRYTDEHYELEAKILANNMEPIKRRYCILCKTCEVEQCYPWKSQDKILV